MCFYRDQIIYTTVTKPLGMVRLVAVDYLYIGTGSMIFYDGIIQV